MDDGGQLNAVVGYQEARRHRADEHIFGGDHLGLCLAYPAVQGDAAQIDLPGGQGVRQLQGDFGFAIRAGQDFGVPVGGIGEVFTHYGGDIPAASAAHAHRGKGQALGVGRQREAVLQAVGLPGIEGVQDVGGIGVGQGQHRQVHHGERELALHGLAGAVGDQHFEGHLLAGAGALGLAGQGDVEGLGKRLHRQLDIALAEIGLALFVLTQQGDRDVDIGGVLGGQGHRQVQPFGRDGQHLVLHDDLALEGDQGGHFTAEGVGDEDLSGLAGLVGAFIGQQAQAAVGQVGPDGLAGAADPQGKLGEGALPGRRRRVIDFQLEGAWLGRGEGQARLAVGAAGEVGAANRSVLWDVFGL